jgi:hypothetical protein
VQLHAKLTEVGTLEIWCAEIAGSRKWRLQFDVRDATQKNLVAATDGEPTDAGGIIEEATLDQCRAAIASAFAKTSSPAPIVKTLEQILSLPRAQWPPALMRSLWEVLLPLEPARNISAEHEARWLNLIGFCLRPGYGLPVDDWRVGQVWRHFSGGVRFAKNEQNRAEWWILWRRLAGGLTAGQQNTLAEPLLADWRNYFRKNGVGAKGRSPEFQFGPHESAETWRLLGSLETLKPALKIELGELLAARLATWNKPGALRDAQLLALGRIGARQSVYGPLDALVPAPNAQAWLESILQSERAAPTAALSSPSLRTRPSALRLRLEEGEGRGEGSFSSSEMPTTKGQTPHPNPPPEYRERGQNADDRAALAAALLARRIGDRFRDINEEVRTQTLAWLRARNVPAALIELVEFGGRLGEQQQRAVFGENLPLGLRIE